MMARDIVQCQKFRLKRDQQGNRFAMDVETGINGRLANRHATEGQGCASHRPRHAAGSTGRQVGQSSGLIDVTAGTLDVNLTGAGRAERKTNWQRRATNHTSVVFSKYAQRTGLAADDVLTHSGRVCEKLRDVDV
jgi:hypothetical protein